MAEGMGFGTEAFDASNAKSDIEERIERIERTLAEVEPDTSLILHDLKELDIAAEATGDDEAKREAARLRNELLERFGD